MICKNCKNKVSDDRKMCPKCFFTLEPIPIPSEGKIHFGGYDWIILNKCDDRTLVLTEKVIAKSSYHRQGTNVTWETCDLRKYLNEEFYNSFSEFERSQIVEVVNENDNNPWYNTVGGNSTNDKIFLLSLNEVVQYFGDSGQLATKNLNTGCDWLKDEFFFFLSDKYNFARVAVDDTGRVAFWRLRSPGANARYAAVIFGDETEDAFECCGHIDISGSHYSKYDIDIYKNNDDDNKEWDGHMVYDRENITNKIGIRPAMWLRSSKGIMRGNV